MLIEATHPEEIRVVITENDIVQEYDYVTHTKDQNKGNIYLAKVTRVEPSLQAAFVDYGQERQGFLPFAEIHPDYYQIPLQDRQALLAEAEAAYKESEQPKGRRKKRRHSDEEHVEGEETNDENEAIGEDADNGGEQEGDDNERADQEEEEIETLSQDSDDELRSKRRNLAKRYNINEVIKKGQIMLIQVTKEERGNKGAALTTYLSLAGRYCVLMPNTANAGGVSRKVTNHDDRYRLKEIVESLNEDTPQGMSVIMRTAGADRSKPEIKRDYDYLQRLWNDIRELTLKSTAPALVYEENDIIKRSIRDLYRTEIEHVLVAGEEAYKSARTFMKMLMPSHAAKVKEYKGNIPLFYEFQVEDQLNSMHEPVVSLPSGGYLVINPTEALVSVDVNSGRATRERNVESTALRTNIEAAQELARQLRLRDLAGLLVIDFIDMYEFRHRRQVEKALREALKHDRAKIQLGRISAFGLLEMSRQRLRPSLTEANSKTCEHCNGTGTVRSVSSFALQVFRAIEKCTDGIEPGTRLQEKMGEEAAFYMLNQKREPLTALEKKFSITIEILGEHSLHQSYTIHRFDIRRGWVLIAPLPEDQRRRRDRGGNQGQRRIPEGEVDNDPIVDEFEEEEATPAKSNIRKREAKQGKHPRREQIIEQLKATQTVEFEKAAAKNWKPVPMETPAPLAAREWKVEDEAPAPSNGDAESADISTEVNDNAPVEAAPEPKAEKAPKAARAPRSAPAPKPVVEDDIPTSYSYAPEAPPKPVVPPIAAQAIIKDMVDDLANRDAIEAAKAKRRGWWGKK
ncbi:Rne/Rng family ribonuclease [bacterium]|nr:Rne/Rng family ribonuclease [bacterium]